MLKSEAALLRNRQGYHWMSLAQEAAAHQPSDVDLLAIALGYPDKLIAGEYSVRPFDFGFPYIKSEYNSFAVSVRPGKNNIETESEAGTSEQEFRH